MKNDFFVLEQNLFQLKKKMVKLFHECVRRVLCLNLNVQLNIYMKTVHAYLQRRFQTELV